MSSCQCEKLRAALREIANASIWEGGAIVWRARELCGELGIEFDRIPLSPLDERPAQGRGRKGTDNGHAPRESPNPPKIPH